MRIRKEDVIESEKLWVRLESEREKTFLKEFDEFNEKILTLYDGLDRAKKLGDGAAAFKIAGQIESYQALKFNLQRKRAEEIERLTRGLTELAAPYVQQWIEQLQAEANRILKAKTFDVVRVETDLINEIKYFTISSNVSSVSAINTKIQNAILGMWQMVAPLSKIEAFYRKALDAIPDISDLKTEQLEMSSFDFEEMKDSLTPAIGVPMVATSFEVERLAKIRGEADGRKNV